MKHQQGSLQGCQPRHHADENNPSKQFDSRNWCADLSRLYLVLSGCVCACVNNDPGTQTLHLLCNGELHLWGLRECNIQSPRICGEIVVVCPPRFESQSNQWQHEANATSKVEETGRE